MEEELPGHCAAAARVVLHLDLDCFFVQVEKLKVKSELLIGGQAGQDC
jgi:hypothetical protein